MTQVGSVFASIFAGLPRQGPGCPSDTLRALTVIQSEQAEIELYRSHGDSCGYVFFVLQGRS
jgi:hypothetical protein